MYIKIGAQRLPDTDPPCVLSSDATNPVKHCAPDIQIEDDISLMSELDFEVVWGEKFQADSGSLVGSLLCSFHGKPKGSYTNYISFIINFTH